MIRPGGVMQRRLFFIVFDVNDRAESDERLGEAKIALFGG